MGNPIKYSTTGDTLSLKKGNFYFGTGDVGKGESTGTRYYNGVTPSASGYTIYSYNSGQTSNISYHSSDTDSDLITYTNTISSQNFTGVTQCLNWYSTQTDYVCINMDYEDIVTDELIFNLDAAYTPSYGTSGNTWYDISYSGNNGTLINGPTYSSNDGGTMVFDGVNDRIDYNNIVLPSGSSYSTSIWYYQTLSTSGGFFGNSVTGRASATEVEWTESLSPDYIKVDDNTGKIYVSGSFAIYNGNSDYTSLIRLNSDGSIDTTFNCTGFNYSTEYVTIDSNGKIYVCGIFTSYQGLSRNRIIRLNDDGSIDNNFSIGTGFNGAVYNIKIDGDGKLYVVGAFTSYNGVTKRGIVKLNTDGTIDNSFDIGDAGFKIGTSTAAVNIFALELDNNGKIYVGGDFTTYKGTSVPRICRLNTDGSLDTTFVVGNGFNSTVRDIAVDSNNDIYVGGLFTEYNGVNNNFFSKLTSSGSIDNTFTNTVGFRAGTSTGSTLVYQVKIDGNGKVCVVGDFTTWNSASTNALRMVRLNTDGSVDSTFPMVSGPSTNVYCLDFDSNGDWYIGGPFTSYKGSTAIRIAKVSGSNALIDTSFSSGTGFSQGLFRVRYTFGYAAPTYTALSMYTGPNSSNYVRKELQTPYYLDRWINFVLTYNGSNRNVRAYVNGVLAVNTTLTAATTDASLNVNRIGYDIGSAYLGGSISNCLIYNKFLSATEVLQNYNAQKGRFGL